MATRFIVPQPPLNDKYQLLVEEISVSGDWGMTTDIDMINYNLKLLEVEFGMSIQKDLPTSTKGISGVVPIGKFITIIQIKKDDSDARMAFYDFSVELEKVFEPLKETFSENVVTRWMELYHSMKTNFSEAEDRVELFKP
jgi:hypothetical protein